MMRFVYFLYLFFVFIFFWLTAGWHVTIRQVWRRWRWRRGWWRRWSWSAGSGSRCSRSWCRSRYRSGTPAMTIFILKIRSLQFQFNLCLRRFSKFKFYARKTQSDSSAKSRVFELETLIFFIHIFMYLANHNFWWWFCFNWKS